MPPVETTNNLLPFLLSSFTLCEYSFEAAPVFDDSVSRNNKLLTVYTLESYPIGWSTLVVLGSAIPSRYTDFKRSSQ